jgi:hypothetical protein
VLSGLKVGEKVIIGTGESSAKANDKKNHPPMM